MKKSVEGASGNALFAAYENLYQEYKVFNYDSAYNYAQKQLTLAMQLNDQDRINCSRLKFGFILLSAGLFKEAFDTLKVIPAPQLKEDCKRDYFTLLARCYYDLADYTMDRNYSPFYNVEGNRFLDSALRYQTSDFDLSYYKGLRNIRAGKIEEARTYFRGLIDARRLTLHQQALATSTMSDIYIQKGQIDSAIQLLVKAAIADIQSSTKETSAIFNLSNLLFKQGDLKNASAYIEKAVKDAVSYGARQRKVQMSAILPLIEGEKISRVEHEKRTLVAYAVVVTLLLLLLIFLTVVIAKQIKKLKKAQEVILRAHREQQELNARLVEANKIKEEYIGFLFSANTSFFDKMDRFKRKTEQKIADRKLDEILFLVNNLDIKQEREAVLKNFDRIFLKIFPHFIETYQSLFAPDDRPHLKENEGLNTELRIFALIRLGIRDNDKIAAILGYSVNTINTYKTKIKNKSLVSNEQFEDRVLEIKSV
ncbi:MAG TPA: DUF6377 domain-containing protein [Flavisolibacter sp.]|nr:DUF6377 domain-containing protein [Flavisolibacter sp.]